MLRSRSPITPGGVCPALRDGADGGPAAGLLDGVLASGAEHQELADALLASRSAIAGAVSALEALGLVRRSRAAGERMDRSASIEPPDVRGGSTSLSTGSRASSPAKAWRCSPMPPRAASRAAGVCRVRPIFSSSGCHCSSRSGTSTSGAARRRPAFSRSISPKPKGRLRMTSGSVTPAIVARAVGKSFGEHRVLDQVDLTVAEARSSRC